MVLILWGRHNKYVLGLAYVSGRPTIPRRPADMSPIADNVHNILLHAYSDQKSSLGPSYLRHVDQGFASRYSCIVTDCKQLFGMSSLRVMGPFS